MRITANNGAAVTLDPLRWQFPSNTGDWDDQWLIIDGHVDLGAESWSFTDPCLLMAEARGLTAWLRAASEGRISLDPRSIGEEPQPSLSFMEPALGFSVAAHNESDLVVRVHLTAEGAPPRLRDHDPHLAHHIVDLQVHPDELFAAADTWKQQLDALPARPWVDPG